MNDITEKVQQKVLIYAYAYWEVKNTNALNFQKDTQKQFDLTDEEFNFFEDAMKELDSEEWIKLFPFGFNLLAKGIDAVKKAIDENPDLNSWINIMKTTLKYT